MSFSKRPDRDAVCYTKSLDSLKCWNDHFFWVDSFACLASFPWHTEKNICRDLFLKSTEFSANDYVVFVAHPALFQKFSEPFLCLIGMSHNYTLDKDIYPTFFGDDGTEMDLFASIQVADPTKSELEESVKRLFDEGDSPDQGDSAGGGGQDTSTGLVTRVKIIVAENVTAKKPKLPRKKRQAVTDASGSSRPPKKLRGDYGTSGEVATSGKSPYVLKE
nr:hypothetical protein [Tanacetum cinerariifolium]